MREKDFLKIRKDTEMYIANDKVLVHCCDYRLYILSNISKLNGSTCKDFCDYKDRYLYSYYAYSIPFRDWDRPFKSDYLSRLQLDKEILGCL